MAKSRKTTGGDKNVYTLAVFLTGGPVSEKFIKKNPVISRTIQLRGEQTLEDLHYAIFNAFDREDDHMYEFQFGKGPMDPGGPRYVLPMYLEGALTDTSTAAGTVDKATLDSLGLEPGRNFGYWFDFGDDWYHHIRVESIEKTLAKGRFPKVTEKVGASPPQY